MGLDTYKHVYVSRAAYVISSMSDSKAWPLFESVKEELLKFNLDFMWNFIFFKCTKI